MSTGLSGKLAPIACSIDSLMASAPTCSRTICSTVPRIDSSNIRNSTAVKVPSDAGAAVVVMHIKGTPRDMQQNPVYDDVVVDVMSYLEEGIAIAVKAGVDREKILVDPGIGFGKTLEHNLTLLNRLDEFRSLGRPIVLGTSRKKFIGTILGIPVPGQRVDGTAPTLALGIERGANVVRVHDVARMAQVVRMTDAVLRGQFETRHTKS